MIKDQKNQLSFLTIILHWLIVITIIGLIVVGIYMEENEVYALYPWHKSLGVMILAFIGVRVVWRAMNGWLEPAGEYTPWEKKLSKIVHWLLIIGMLLFPVSGMLMSGFGGHGINVFGLELMPVNFDPSNPQKVLPVNENLAGVGHIMHGMLGNVFIVLIALHMLGALKHHFVDRDLTLKRMLGRS